METYGLAWEIWMDYTPESVKGIQSMKLFEAKQRCMYHMRTAKRDNRVDRHKFVRHYLTIITNELNSRDRKK